jgi:Rap1a immunity proteins
MGMSKGTAVLIGVLSALVYAAPSYAEFLDGNRLFELCDDEAPDYKQDVCLGYVMGVIDVLVSYSDVEIEQRIGLCAPKNVSAAQLREIVVRYLKQHPEERHYAALNTVGAAVRDAFPCAKKM